MEHSKLPWKKEECKLHSGHFDITGNDGRVITCVKGDREKYADFIVTACNEHDTLQAKADLLDEMVHSYTQMEGHLGHYIRMFEEQFPQAKSLVVMQAKQYELDEILKNYEALKCTNPKK